MATLDDATREQIAVLTKKVEALLVRNRFDTLDALVEERHALLARHLGFIPSRPVPTVMVVGDSHARFFAGTEEMRQIRYRRVFKYLGFIRPEYITRSIELLPCFRVFNVGPSTAWQAFEYGSSTCGREKLDLLTRKVFDRRVPVLLSYGEIDCRCHIPKIVQTGVPIAQAVERTIKRFLRLPLHLRSLGFSVCIWGPPCVSPIRNDPSFPASYELRSHIIRAYKQSLEKMTADAGIPCVCLAGLHHAWEEEPPTTHLHDGLHLAQSLMPLALDRLHQAGILSFTRQRL